jgi:hypothetical protein
VKRWNLVTWILWASLFGLIVALLRGSDLVVSVELWLAGFTTWLAVTIIVQTSQNVPLGHRSEDPTQAIRRQASPRDPRPPELRQLERQLRHALRDQRAYTTQLRPRLIALADHYLPLHHGVDRRLQPEIVREILGPAADVIVYAEVTTPPTLIDLEHFIARLTTDPALELGQSPGPRALR